LPHCVLVALRLRYGGRAEEGQRKGRGRTEEGQRKDRGRTEEGQRKDRGRAEEGQRKGRGRAEEGQRKGRGRAEEGQRKGIACTFRFYRRGAWALHGIAGGQAIKNRGEPRFFGMGNAGYWFSNLTPT
jgi:hypothetical protein